MTLPDFTASAGSACAAPARHGGGGSGAAWLPPSRLPCAGFHTLCLTHDKHACHKCVSESQLRGAPCPLCRAPLYQSGAQLSERERAMQRAHEIAQELAQEHLPGSMLSAPHWQLVHDGLALLERGENDNAIETARSSSSRFSSCARKLAQ